VNKVLESAGNGYQLPKTCKVIYKYSFDLLQTKQYLKNRITPGKITLQVSPSGLMRMVAEQNMC